MKTSKNARFIAIATLFVVGAGWQKADIEAAESTISPAQLAFFEAKIRPVLIQACYSCHSSKTGNAKGGLRLDTEQLTRMGGSSGPAIVAGDPESSLVYNAISYQDFAMPPSHPLSQTIVDDFRKWIEMGAPDPRKTEIAQLNSTISADEIATAKASFWAYQVPQLPTVPNSQNDSWSRSNIDHFVRAKLEEAGLNPAPDAAPRQILRRLYYDLIGLPPNLDQINDFASAYQVDPEDAIFKVVDSLLELPQFGERWGRHWLDLARYAESNGREVNMTFPHAWRYRDFVINSFNDDKPYDRFLQQQIAGDLLPINSDQEWTENLIATTFLAIGPKSLSERNRVQFEADVADEQLDTTTRVALGTSVACARCHDHKFDPIPQSDYYALAGIFANTETFFGTPASQFGVVGGIQNRNNSNLIRLPKDDPNPFDKTYSRAELDAMTDQVREIRQDLAEYRTSMQRGTSTNQTSQNAIQNLVRSQTQLESLSSTLGSVDDAGRPISFCMGAQDRNRPQNIRVLVRGEIDQPGPIAARDFPQVLRDEPAMIKPNSSGRLEFARWLTSRDNPLTSRVMVNRVWQHLIGTGIVRTTEDFGSTGQAPTHPELLDFLAIRFMDSNWSIKSMIRDIATSRVYRINSAADSEKLAADPDNHWLSRANPRRQSAEAMRDSMLAVSGELNLERPRASEVAKVGYTQVRDGNLINVGQMSSALGDQAMRQANMRQMGTQRARGLGFGGPGMAGRGMGGRGMGGPGMSGFGFGNPGMHPGLRSGGTSSERVDMVDANYRSVYLPILRDELPRSLSVFDVAEPSMVIGSREASNTPNQALFMMNNDLVIRLSDAFARRVIDQALPGDKAIEEAFLLAYGRPSTSDERRAVQAFASEFVRELRLREPAMQTLSAICQSLFASAEFRYID